MEDAQEAGRESAIIVAGNRLTLLEEGPDRLAALLALIDGARTSLRLLYYIYANDHAGRAVRDALAAALARGVSVSLLIDGFGSEVDDAFFAPLTGHGGEVCRFIPRYGRRYLLRNHQKLALADGQRVIIGGFNIEDTYFGSERRGAWRDIGLLLEGAAAERLVGYYDALAAWAKTPRARLRDLRRALSEWSEPDGPVRWLLGGPTRRLSPWALAVKRDMRGAKRLAMIAAYFVPTPAMMRRMEAIGRRGDARLITAAKSDHPAAISAARHCYARLIRRGVKIYEYQPTRLHSKMIAIDGVVHIGSANFDVRSLFLNLELMLRIDDAAFAEKMHDYFRNEIAHSQEITREKHRRMAGIVNRLLWGLAYFVLAVVDASVTRGLAFGVERR